MTLIIDAVDRFQESMFSSEMSGLEFDLSCSETSADFSPDSEHSSNLHEQEICLMEYRFLNTVEARNELQWLFESESRTWAIRPQISLTKSQNHLRQLLVDNICLAGERMHVSFMTKALAISYLDRFMASIPGQDDQLTTWAAMACLAVAAKTDGVGMSTQMLTTQLCSCWEMKMPQGNLGQVELMVLSVLGWSIQDVTAATVLDTLICLLGCKHNSTYKAGCYEQINVVRESSRLLLAKTFKDPIYSRLRPSVLATAACLLVLDRMIDTQIDTSNFQQALTEVFGLNKNHEIQQCMQYLMSTQTFELIPSLRHCRVEGPCGQGLVRVYQQKVLLGVTYTPTSVLKSAQAMDFQSLHKVVKSP